MRKYLAVTLLLLFMFSMLASVQPAHAKVMLDQKETSVNATDCFDGYVLYVGFGGKITSWKDGDEYVITIDDDMGVAGGGTIDLCMPYYFDDAKDSQITNIDISPWEGIGHVQVVEWSPERVQFVCYGSGGCHVQVECRFQDYGDSSVTVYVLACTGADDDWEDVELSLTKVKAVLYLSTTSGGTTDPAVGTHTYDYGSSVPVTATADGGYEFNYWMLDGEYVYDSSINVIMDSDHNLKAYFKYVGGGGGNGGWQLEPCPTLFVWNGNDYVDYGVINIHNPSGEDMVKEVPIQMEDVGLNNHKATFRLREGWEGLNQSESVIDQVKLYAIGDNGKQYLCPLTSATHSTLGNVLPQLLLSDDVKAQILLLETIDLTFIVPCQNIQSYTFVIEGCNMYK